MSNQVLQHDEEFDIGHLIDIDASVFPNEPRRRIQDSIEFDQSDRKMSLDRRRINNERRDCAATSSQLPVRRFTIDRREKSDRRSIED